MVLVNLLVFSSTLICRLCTRRSSTVLGEERIYRTLRGTQKAVTMASSRHSAHEGDWRGQLDKPEIKIDSFGRLILSSEGNLRRTKCCLRYSPGTYLRAIFFSRGRIEECLLTTMVGFHREEAACSLKIGDIVELLIPALLLTWRVSRPQMSLTRLKSRYM